MEFVDRFVETMLKLPRAKISPNKKEIIAQCQCCGDSKNIYSAHMYIKIPYNDELPVYHCFRCNESGIVTPSTLMKWQLSDNTDMLVDLSGYNKRTSQLSKNRMYSDVQIYRLQNLYVTQDKLSEVKLKYLNWRLGTNITFDDVVKLKIVLNIYDLLNSNRIVDYTRSTYIMDQINSSFLGFISYDNAFINMRRLVPEDRVHRSISKRYINYSIFNKFDTTWKYYVIPTNVSVTRPERIKIRIAEGPMDILSIYFNVEPNHDHTIYGAITGSSYYQMVQFFLIDIKLSYVEFHIYADNDKPDEFFINIANLLKTLDIPFYIHRNIFEGEKDYGVPKNKIKDFIYTL